MGNYFRALLSAIARACLMAEQCFYISASAHNRYTLKL
jgi:hypothetical protein